MTTQAVSNSERGCWTTSHSGSISSIQIFEFKIVRKGHLDGLSRGHVESNVMWLTGSITVEIFEIFIRRKFNKSYNDGYLHPKSI